MDSRGGIHEEFGYGMRADLGEYRAQSGFETRTDARARIEAPRLACRRHAAQCDWLRAGQRVRLLRLWLSYRSETILGQDLACGRASARREVRRRDSRGESARHARYRDRCGSLVEKRPSGGRDMQAGRGGVRSDSYCCATVALRTGEPAHRTPLASAPGFERKRNL